MSIILCAQLSTPIMQPIITQDSLFLGLPYLIVTKAKQCKIIFLPLQNRALYVKVCSNPCITRTIVVTAFSVVTEDMWLCYYSQSSAYWSIKWYGQGSALPGLRLLVRKRLLPQVKELEYLKVVSCSTVGLNCSLRSGAAAAVTQPLSWTVTVETLTNPHLWS